MYDRSMDILANYTSNEWRGLFDIIMWWIASLVFCFGVGVWVGNKNKWFVPLIALLVAIAIGGIVEVFYYGR